VCHHCHSHRTDFVTPTEVPPILYFNVHDSNIKLDHELRMTVKGVPITYMLRGVIYSGGNHFTCRVVRESGDVWYHDGIGTGAKLFSEGNLHSKPPKFLNTCIKDDYFRLMAGAIYACS
ncbi:hypothetical protein R3P38DRAFT_2573321, partial [Favolaschia claudopus]